VFGENYCKHHRAEFENVRKHSLLEAIQTEKQEHAIRLDGSQSKGFERISIFASERLEQLQVENSKLRTEAQLATSALRQSEHKLQDAQQQIQNMQLERIRLAEKEKKLEDLLQQARHGVNGLQCQPQSPDATAITVELSQTRKRSLQLDLQLNKVLQGNVVDNKTTIAGGNVSASNSTRLMKHGHIDGVARDTPATTKSSSAIRDAARRSSIRRNSETIDLNQLNCSANGSSGADAHDNAATQQATRRSGDGCNHSPSSSFGMKVKSATGNGTACHASSRSMVRVNAAVAQANAAASMVQSLQAVKRVGGGGGDAAAVAEAKAQRRLKWQKRRQRQRALQDQKRRASATATAAAQPVSVPAPAVTSSVNKIRSNTTSTISTTSERVTSFSSAGHVETCREADSAGSGESTKPFSNGMLVNKAARRCSMNRQQQKLQAQKLQAQQVQQDQEEIEQSADLAAASSSASGRSDRDRHRTGSSSSSSSSSSNSGTTASSTNTADSNANAVDVVLSARALGGTRTDSPPRKRWTRTPVTLLNANRALSPTGKVTYFQSKRL
jgi:hypothetical protein